MPGWDLLDDEQDEPERAKAGSPAASIWDSLDDGPSYNGNAHNGRGSPAATWQPLDSEPKLAEPALPASELAASQLKNGEVLWARVDGQGVTLGSGQPLYVPKGVPDGIGGWRRVRITDAASLSAEVLLLQVEQPVQGVADEPALLFPPDPAQPAPLRPAGFPVGEGGDLAAAFEARVRNAQQDYRRMAREAQEGLQRRGDMLERQLREDYDRRIQAAAQRTEARFQEAVQRIQAKAAQEVEYASQAARQSDILRREADRTRDAARTALTKAGQERARGLAAAAVGWICVLVLLVVVLAH